MRPIRATIALVAAMLALAGERAFAQTIASAGPQTVAVTIYRAPDRAPQDALDPDWLEGYALVTETRTIAIPAGRSTIRFEGVAGGILPESAIVSGLPEGVREKNLDADVLSPRSLYARSFGRPVTIRRSRGDTVVEERAVIRSGPDGAAIVETANGFYAANCTRESRERLIYDSVPTDLSAKPTLSIEVESAQGGQARLTLSYLAWGFDWQADYVATMGADGRSADLFAWVTLANSDVTSFADAETMVVAGRIRNESERRDYGTRADLELQCYFHPIVRTRKRNSETVVDAITAENIGAFPDSSIAESLQRVPGVGIMRFAAQEELGDLKLYRVPDRTTVAANSQKQVALLDREKVPVDVVYRSYVLGAGASEVMLMLRAQNRKDMGLGLPLPAGRVAVFEQRGTQRLLLGEGWTADKTIGEEVEVDVAQAAQVRAEIARVGRKGARSQSYALTVTNANPHPVRFEGHFAPRPEFRMGGYSARLGRKNGRDLWAVDVPANGRVTLRYRLARIRR